LEVARKKKEKSKKRDTGVPYGAKKVLDQWKG